MGGSRFSVWLNAVILAFFLAALGATGSSDDDTNYLSSDDGVNQYATDIGWEGVLEFIRGGGNDGGPVEGGRADNRASRREEVSAHHQPHEPAAPPRPVYVSLPEYGDMEGRRESSVDVFRAVPFAAPPVGSLRFAPPEPPSRWHPAKLDASFPGPDCWQPVDPVVNPLAKRENMSEDCLYLNVYAPAGSAARSRQGTRNLLPVMVWFHGGGFQQGGANRPEFDGRRLAEQDVIVVTVNYRLGALGFLVSSGDGLFGNFGLMDQRAALDWVHSNVQFFGGDPGDVTLFGESAGAVMIGLHLTMEGAGTLFHKAIMQSNPMGYAFRSVVVANFLGEALKHAVDCRDVACLRAERVEEILRAQSGLMGVPRSVGDFFTWGPTRTTEARVEVAFGRSGAGHFVSRASEHRVARLDRHASRGFVSAAEWRRNGAGGTSLEGGHGRWAVNVTQPMDNYRNIPDSIPIVVGSNRHEGEIFVYTAFPAPMPKAVYWMGVGALFRDSSSRVLKHYRGLVDDVERKAQKLARVQIEEEEAKQKYFQNRRKFNSIHDVVRQRRMSRGSDSRRKRLRRKFAKGESTKVKADVNTWTDGADFSRPADNKNGEDNDEALDFLGFVSSQKRGKAIPTNDSLQKSFRYGQRGPNKVSRSVLREESRAKRRERRQRARALREAAKVEVDYRPVLSKIIDDYLFRCPSWRFAQQISEHRERRRRHENNVFVYRFSQPTHIPGYEECWGKSCHTAEVPYVFASMNVLHSNYSALSPYAQKEAPSPPEYPYTEFLSTVMTAAAKIADESSVESEEGSLPFQNPLRNSTKAFRRVVKHFFGEYYLVNADDELANDMVNRWSSFAKKGSPNFEGAKAEWLPWRFRPSRLPQDKARDYNNHMEEIWPDDFYEGWDKDEDRENGGFSFSDNEYDSDLESDIDEEDFMDGSAEWRSESKNHAALKRYYRRRALAALEMEEANEEDLFRTELKRKQRMKGDSDKSIAFKLFSWYRDEGETSAIPRNMARELIKKALDIGALGTGLSSDYQQTPKANDFLPDMFELTWPPEGRLIEGDCSCDMWDDIKYRY